MAFDNDNLHVFINSKYYRINEGYFGIIHLNMESLKKHLDNFCYKFSKT